MSSISLYWPHVLMMVAAVWPPGAPRSATGTVGLVMPSFTALKTDKGEALDPMHGRFFSTALRLEIFSELQGFN